MLSEPVSDVLVRLIAEMSARRHTAYLSLMTFILSGCLAVPFHHDDEDPYKNIKTNLLIGSMTKESMVALLDEPVATYMKGSQWVYTTPEIEWEVITAGISASSTIWLGEQHFLILNFDGQGKLVDYLIESADVTPGRCTPTQFCHDGANGVMRFVDKETESRIKKFPIARDQCGIFLYGRGNYSVTLNGERRGSVFWPFHIFFFWQVDPGDHEIAVYPHPVALSVNCKKNELMFVHFIRDFWRGKNSELNIVEASEGRNWIIKKNRRLIYSESGWFEKER